LGTLRKQLEDDTRALFEFLVRRDPLPPSHVRIVASAIVRKWLVDNQLGRLGRETVGAFTLPALDTKAVAEAIAAGVSVRFFMAGGVSMDGVPIKGFYVSDEPFHGTPPIPIASLEYVDMRPSKFLSARRVFHNGNWFTTDQIIRFMANKYGGVHFDPTRGHPWQQDLERASEFFTVGNPENLKERKLIETTSPRHNIHLVLPKETGHLWTCLDIELLAIAQSLGNIKCNGARLIEVEKPESKWSLRLLIRRLTSR